MTIATNSSLRLCVQFLNGCRDGLLEFHRGVQLDLVFRQVLEDENKLNRQLGERAFEG